MVAAVQRQIPFAKNQDLTSPLRGRQARDVLFYERGQGEKKIRQRPRRHQTTALVEADVRALTGSNSFEFRTRPA